MKLSWTFASSTPLKNKIPDFLDKSGISSKKYYFYSSSDRIFLIKSEYFQLGIYSQFIEKK